MDVITAEQAEQVRELVRAAFNQAEGAAQNHLFPGRTKNEMFYFTLGITSGIYCMILGLPSCESHVATVEYDMLRKGFLDKFNPFTVQPKADGGAEA